jgi:TPR repeat protein
MPLARTLMAAIDAGNKLTVRPSPDEVSLLSRCARLLESGRGSHGGRPATPEEIRGFWDIAAAEHDRHGQMAVGLWYARMQVDGRRVAGGAGSANFKKAIRWLTLAGEQGLAEAWYALSRIYIKPEFSQRNVADAQRYLERAAEMGYREAQLECGNSAWRARRENENNDVRAVYWLQKAAAQDSAEAREALAKIAPRGEGVAYGWCDGVSLGRDLAASHPLLAARLDLAATFKLTRAEALLLDIKQADQGHCLVIDIRASYGRSKRRLIAVSGTQERQVLDRVGRLFENVDCGPNGPEGNYRQRLYRLKTLVPESATGEDSEHEAYELAAA